MEPPGGDRDNFCAVISSPDERLGHGDQRDDARHALRNFADKIVIPPATELLQVVGNLGAMLDAAAGQRMRGRQAVGDVGRGGSHLRYSQLWSGAA